MEINDIAALLEQEIASQRLAERKSIDGIATNDLVALLAGWESLQLARGSGLPAPPRTAPHNSGRRSARPILLDGAPATERELHVSGRPATALFETPEARSLQEATRLRPP